MYPRTLSTHSLCIRPATPMEVSKNMPKLLTGVEGFKYNEEYMCKNWLEGVLRGYDSKDKVECFYLLTSRKTNEVVGIALFNDSFFISVLEEYRRRGYAKEAALSISDYIKSNRQVFGKLFVTVDFTNDVHVRLLEKYCGAEFVSCDYDAGEFTYYI